MGIITSIKNAMDRWDRREQQVRWLDIPTIISRIESWHFKTKKVTIDLTVPSLESHSFNCPDLFDFIIHYKLVERANLKYPIIVNKKWSVIDWRHRMAKAIIEWKKSIKAIMILEDIGEN